MFASHSKDTYCEVFCVGNLYLENQDFVLEEKKYKSLETEIDTIYVSYYYAYKRIHIFKCDFKKVHFKYASCLSQDVVLNEMNADFYFLIVIWFTWVYEEGNIEWYDMK